MWCGAGIVDDMAVLLDWDEPRRLIRTVVHCDACHRTAASDRMTSARLRRLISWERSEDAGDLCVDCQVRRGIVPRFTRRFSRRS